MRTRLSSFGSLKIGSTFLLSLTTRVAFKKLEKDAYISLSQSAEISTLKKSQIVIVVM